MKVAKREVTRSRLLASNAELFAKQYNGISKLLDISLEFFTIPFQNKELKINFSSEVQFLSSTIEFIDAGIFLRSYNSINWDEIIEKSVSILLKTTDYHLLAQSSHIHDSSPLNFQLPFFNRKVGFFF